MPIISPTAISPHRIGGAKNWSSYWATLISATVENAAPTNVVLTYPVGKPELLATDITATVNGVARAVSSASWTGGIWTVVLASAVEYGDVVVMTFKTGQTTNVTNNVLTYAALLTSVGTGDGVSTLRMWVSSDITVTLGANGKFYTDSGGTLNESATWTITAGALRTIYLKCTSGTATMTFSDASKILRWGDSSADGWTSAANAAHVTLVLAKFSAMTICQITGRSTLIGAFPSLMSYIRIEGNDVAWTHNGSLPSETTTLILNGTAIDWTYNGTIPAGISLLYLAGDGIKLTSTDIPVASITYIRLIGANINVTLTGTLNVSTTYFYLDGNGISYTSSNALPNTLNYLRLNGNNLNWTGLSVGSGSNIGTFLLQNYRAAKMSSADMVTFLTQLTNRTGRLPTTITINDYADYASPPAEVVAAVNALKLAKSITTVTLGA